MATKTQVNTDSVQTLSNKTLTAPTINGGVCGGDPSVALGVATKQYVDAVVLFPPGIMMPYGGSAAPTGWLSCDGSAVSRATYAALFAICGITYGAGDGSTTFNLPNKCGRTSVGSGTGSGLTARTRGTKAGEETHLLTAAESGLPAHVHNLRGSTNDGFSTSNTRVPILNAGVDNGSAINPDLSAITSTGGSAAVSAHNVMQPYEVDLWIIKT